MGLLQRAYETYRNLEGYIGVPSKDNFSMLAPVYHIYRNTTAVIKISMDGKFVGIDWFQKEIHGKLKDAPEKIIVPVCSLTNNAKAWSPYVLCADYAVISGDVGLVADYDGRDEKKKKKVAEDRDFIRQKHDYYVSNLKDWAESEFTHPIVQAVYKYVSGGTLVDDVKSRSDKKVLKAKDAVAWRVLGIESGSTSFCYQNKDLFVAHIRRMRKLLAIESDTADELVNEDGSNLDSVLKKIDLKLTYGQGLCFVTGGVVPMMLKHPQGPIPVFSSSKLLSSSDDKNFVYRGRFKNATQAFGVSCEVSWAAHNVLTWLADNGGVMVYNAEVPDKPNRSFFGNRVFLCWSPSGKPVPTVMNNKFDTGFKDMEKPKFSLVKYRNASDYLKNKLSRLGKAFDLHDVVVVASFTAATNGRLSLTSYHEIDANAYFKLFEDWYSSMSFFECKNGYYVYFVPSVFVICLYMFGVVKSTDKNIGYLELPKKTDGKSNGVLGAFGEMFELVNNSMINQAPLNAVVVNTLVDRASRLYLIKYVNIRERLLSVACAVVRKYNNDRLKKEVYSVMLVPDLKDRSYQFGRLLAVFEIVERATFDKDDSKSREPNAMRYQAHYRARPFSTANQIHDQLASYFAKLNVGSRVFYKNLIAEILEKISEFPETELNRPLGDTYLLGYYLQRKDLYTSKKNDENPNGEN